MPIKRINTRRPAPQPVANPDCLARLTRIAKWGAGAFIALIACGALANLAPRSPVTTSQPTAPAPTIAARSITLEPPTATAIPPTATAIPPTATATTAPLRPITLENANLRQGPGTEHPIIGALNAGQELTIIARTPDYDWFQLDTGAWIAAFLVAGVPIDLPIVDKPATAPALLTTAPPIAAQPAESPPNAFTCVGGCAVPPDPSCAIKGNVNSKGEKIYHQPGYRDYDRTDIKPEEGDLWFCTAQEAQAAGFRAPLNH